MGRPGRRRRHCLFNWPAIGGMPLPHSAGGGGEYVSNSIHLGDFSFPKKISESHTGWKVRRCRRKFAVGGKRDPSWGGAKVRAVGRGVLTAPSYSPDSEKWRTPLIRSNVGSNRTFAFQKRTVVHLSFFLGLLVRNRSVCKLSGIIHVRNRNRRACRRWRWQSVQVSCCKRP